MSDGATGRGRLRVLHDGAGEPAWNMAVDEALLLLGEGPTLRLYGWRPHAVSLGWFQNLADFADLPPDVPVVRRLTGGGAIFHGDELTFALAVDADLLPGDVAAGYARVHDAAVAALTGLGVPCRRLAAGHAPSARPTDRWCFAAPGRDDVVTDRGKLLGSAQRRVHLPRPRVLHHGSLVLERPAATPFVAATSDCTPASTEFRTALAERFVALLAEALELVPFVGAATDGEATLAAHLRRTRYGEPRFTARR